MSEQEIEQPTGLAALVARQAAGQEAPAPPPFSPPVPPAAAAAFALGADGVPVQSGVPADFAAAQEAAMAGQLTAEEVAEFRALRAEKKARDEAAAAEAAAAAAKLTPPTHYVHLADGTVTEGHQIATHYATEDGRVVPVTGVFEKQPQLG